MCYQLVLQFSMDVSQTLQTYCGHTGDVHVGSAGARIDFDGFLNLDIFVAFCTVRYEVCVINFLYSFQFTVLKHCRHIVDILEMCM